MHSMRWTLTSIGLVCALAAVATDGLTSRDAQAQADAIMLRQGILGSFGKAVKEPGAMLRQEAPFNLEVVRASLKTIADGPPKLKTLFPDDSKTGAYTEALPTIVAFHCFYLI